MVRKQNLYNTMSTFAWIKVKGSQTREKIEWFEETNIINAFYIIVFIIHNKFCMIKGKNYQLAKF